MKDFSFAEDLSTMSVYELMCWLADHLLSVYREVPGGNGVLEIDDEALQALYDDFTEVVNLTEEDAKQYREFGDLLLSNKKVILSSKYKQAIVNLHRPLPQILLDVGRKEPINISCDIYNQPASVINSLVNSTMVKSAQVYNDKLNCILQAPDMRYREEIMEFISKQRTERRHIDYMIPKNEKWFDSKDINATISQLAHMKATSLKSSGPYALIKSAEKKRLAKEEDKARAAWVFNRPYAQNYIRRYGLSKNPSKYTPDENGIVEAAFRKWKVFGGLQKLTEFCISDMMTKRYMDGEPVERIFLVRLAFSLGMDIDRFDLLMKKEGFSTNGSIRPYDMIYRSSFIIGLPFEFTDKLLRRKAQAEKLPDFKGCRGCKPIMTTKKAKGSLEA